MSRVVVPTEKAARVPQSASRTRLDLAVYLNSVQQKEKEEEKEEAREKGEETRSRERESLAITAVLPRSVVANLYDKQPVYTRVQLYNTTGSPPRLTISTRICTPASLGSVTRNAPSGHRVVRVDMSPIRLCSFAMTYLSLRLTSRIFVCDT